MRRLLLWVMCLLFASLPVFYGVLWLIMVTHPTPPPPKPNLTRLYGGWNDGGTATRKDDVVEVPVESDARVPR